MNNERYKQIIDEAYEDYLKNFIEPICPPNLDVQPSYYEPMTKDWFVKSAKERGSRGDEFSEKWGLKIEERELSLDERLYLVNYDKNRFNSIDEWKNWYNNEPNEFYYMGINYTKETALTDLGVPTKLITITYKDTKIENYERK